MLRLHKPDEIDYRIPVNPVIGSDTGRNAPTEEELVSMQVNRVYRNRSEEFKKAKQDENLPGASELFLQITRDIVFIFDNTGLILDASRRACDFLGYSLQEISYYNLCDIFQFRQNSETGILNFIKEDSVPFEAFLITSSTLRVPAELQSYFIQYNGKKAGMIIVSLLQDEVHTEGEEELQQQVRQLRKKINELEQGDGQNKLPDSNLMKTNFLSNMSHEIRTPMNAIIGFSNLLDDPGINADLVKEYSAVIRSSSMNLLRILDNILELSQVESTKLTLNRNNTFLPQFFNDILCTHQEMVSSMEKDIKLELSFPSTLTEEVYIDQLRLKQVFSNLLHNAIKYTESGTVVFGYSPLDNCQLDFFVSDQGIGIPDDEVDTVFNRFWHGDHKLNRKYGGTGLGLTITRCLVEKMGGTIRVKSIEGKGSKFSFTLPASLVEYTDQPVKLNTIDDSAEVKCGYRFLVAEDEEVNYFLVREILGQLGITPVWVRNGEDVVSKLRHEKFDLVLMDMKMPGMNGFDATRIIREFDPEIPIIALTAYAMENDRKRCIDAGCNNYLAKPVMRDDLFSMLMQYCKGEIKPD
jgi:signal transduction histidine kinase/CheY-like chemotaxis protein